MNNIITPITKINYAGYEIYVKRDDLYPQTGGGNKSRKSDYILKFANNNNYNHIVTNGGVNSNHCRAIALKCKEYNMKCSLIMHSPTKENIKNSKNLMLSKLSGANIEYCSLGELSQKMDAKIQNLKSAGDRPLYLWGGGHCIEGSFAYYKAAQEFIKQTNGLIPDLVFHASGTGTTQAGLAVGFKEYHTAVIGISIARMEERGKQVVLDSAHELAEHLDITYNKDIMFYDKWVYGGYEKYNQEIIYLIKDVAKQTGIILDPTYTAKAFKGMLSVLDENNIEKNKKILFWHTGGLLNLLSAQIK